MQFIHAERVVGSRLRVVFSDAVVSLAFAGDATLEDIAWALDELAPLHPGDPVAIDVRFAARPVSLTPPLVLRNHAAGLDRPLVMANG